jgi:hypothetical protein
MPTARHGLKLVWFDNRIWAVGGYDGLYTSTAESFDPLSNSWRTEASMTTKRNRPFTFVANGEIFVAGGNDGSSSLNSIEAFDPTTNRWKICGNFPSKTYYSDAVELNQNIYVVVGYSSGLSNKVFAADLNASVEGVYDLWRKDGDAPVGTPVVQSEYADGSVTASKMAEGSVSKSALDATILKYLKPEITSQPQALTVYADTNASFSVTAEGKYLTYQWKKDGVDLAGETNATLNITDANATQHDGNYSVMVSNDFGSVESLRTLVDVNSTWSTDGLVGWWKFDDGSGTVAYDSSGNGYHGNLFNGPTWSSGKIDGALSFDGADDRVLIPVPKPSFPFSFSIWIRPNSNNPQGIIDTSPNNHNVLRIHPNGGVFEWWQASPSFELNVTANQWQLIVIQINHTGTHRVLTYYLNGDFVGSYSSLNNNTVGWTVPVLGDVNNGGAGRYNGLLDDVRIYDRALSAEEVQALYNLGQ